jgi:hypothetical protein
VTQPSLTCKVTHGCTALARSVTPGTAVERYATHYASLARGSAGATIRICQGTLVAGKQPDTEIPSLLTGKQALLHVDATCDMYHAQLSCHEWATSCTVKRSLMLPLVGGPGCLIKPTRHGPNPEEVIPAPSVFVMFKAVSACSEAVYCIHCHTCQAVSATIKCASWEVPGTCAGHIQTVQLCCPACQRPNNRTVSCPR